VFELGLREIVVLAVGVVLIGAGLVGLLPLILNQRSALAGRLRIDESLNPAFTAAMSVVLPMPSAFAGAMAGSPSHQVHRPMPAATVAPASTLAPATSLEEREISAAEELLARLFTIRMTLSEVTEEVQALHDAYNLDDDEVVDDIDDADDDLIDIDQDDALEAIPAPGPARKATEAA
jgi:hypothetical protein